MAITPRKTLNAPSYMLGRSWGRGAIGGSIGCGWGWGEDGVCELLIQHVWEVSFGAGRNVAALSSSQPRAHFVCSPGRGGGGDVLAALKRLQMIKSAVSHSAESDNKCNL